MTDRDTKTAPAALAAALAWLSVERTVPAAGASATQNVVVTDIKFDVAGDLARRGAREIENACR